MFIYDRHRSKFNVPVHIFKFAKPKNIFLYLLKYNYFTEYLKCNLLTLAIIIFYVIYHFLRNKVFLIL